MSQLRGFKFVITLVLIKYCTYYSNSKREIIINENDIDDIFESIYITIISTKPKFIGKGSGWIFDSVINRTFNISRVQTFSC